MSRFYVAPGVPIQTRVVGGRSPYSTPPFDYRLNGQNKDLAGRGCRFCPRGCDAALTSKLCKCNCTAKQEGFPQRAVMCDRQFQYYDSTEKMLADKLQELKRQEDRRRRRRAKRGKSCRTVLFHH